MLHAGLQPLSARPQHIVKPEGFSRQVKSKIIHLSRSCGVTCRVLPHNRHAVEKLPRCACLVVGRPLSLRLHSTFSKPTPLSGVLNKKLIAAAIRRGRHRGPRPLSPACSTARSIHPSSTMTRPAAPTRTTVSATPHVWASGSEDLGNGLKAIYQIEMQFARRWHHAGRHRWFQRTAQHLRRPVWRLENYGRR